MDFSEILDLFLTNILNVLIIPLLPIITTYVIAYIKKKTEELENKLQNDQLSQYIDIVENSIISMVSTVDQIFVDDIKAANGSLTAEEKRKAFEMAKSQALSIAGEAAILAMTQLYKDSEAYLNNRIEYYVNQAKSIQ